MHSLPTVKAAAAHAAPVWLDPAASAEKAADWIAEAARHGAELVAFPESFLPGFPLWAALHAPIRTHAHFARFAAASVFADGPEIARIRQAAARACMFVSLGFSERDPASVGALWNSNVIIGDDGAVLVHHRKLVPTFFEKLAWNPGDGAGLQVADTRLGRIGALICGENTNPLARFALMAQGEQIHVSSYPPAWPTRPPAERGNYDNRAANRIRAAAHCFEAKCFGVVATGCLDRAATDDLADGDREAAAVLEATPAGASFFVDPTGAPVGEERTEEGLAYAELDLSCCVEPKRFHDVVAGYNRFDVFDLSVRRSCLAPVRFRDATEPPEQEEPGWEVRRAARPRCGCWRRADMRALGPAPGVRMTHEGYLLRMPGRGVHSLTERITADQDLFIVTHMGLAEVDPATWRLGIDGLVRRPASLSLADVLAMPRHQVTSIHECAGSPLAPTEPKRRVGNVVWSGVRLSDVLDRAGVDAAAAYVWSEGLEWGAFAGLTDEPFVKDLPLAKALAPEVLLAVAMNGAPLTPERGGPVRLVVPGWYGTNSVKWLGRLTLADRRASGPFTTRFYNDPTPEGPRPVWGIAPESILVQPAPDTPPAAGRPCTIMGWAWAEAGVARVEVSTDGGKSWTPAALEPPNEFAWRRFTLPWTPGPGRHNLLCRCTDARGTTQPRDGARNAVQAVEIEAA